MAQEQLLQEARLEAEKVYPQVEDNFLPQFKQNIKMQQDALRAGFIKCYIQQAEKRKNDAEEFLIWCLQNNWGTIKDAFILNNHTHRIEKATYLYELFLQQHKQELYGTKIQF